MPVHDANSNTRRNGYTFSHQGTTTAANTNIGSVGKHILKRIPGADCWNPSWNGSETIIRIYPALNPDNPKEFDPYRLSNSYCDFGDFIRVYEAVRNFGNPGVTMLLHNGMNPSYDAQLMNPCWILYRAINQALSQGQGLGDWVPLTKGGQGKGAVLSKPTKLYLVQCAIFRHKSKDTFGPGQPPLGANPEGGPTIVMALPATAGEAMVRQFEEKEESYQGDSDSYDHYKYGDPVGIDSGKFIHIYELGKDPRSRYNTARTGASPASIYSAAPTTGPGRGLEPKGYGVFITDTLDGGPNDVPATLIGHEEMVRSKIKRWEDILEFKSDEEQAHLVAPLFPASAVLYAWRDHQSWIPDSVREAGSFEARRPVSAGFGTSIAAASTQAWQNTPRPQVKGTATWGSRAQVQEQEPEVVEDSVIPSGEIEELDPVSAAGIEPTMQSDESTRVAQTAAKLKAANERAAKRKQQS